jgi:hypothetical protein
MMKATSHPQQTYSEVSTAPTSQKQERIENPA